ncbi:SIP domain-containing protein [Pimelobacter simplex]|uniref:Siderophore interacting protein n=1 Tax=Nocardioides simplex TaxID=2045 RepID=A0A0J9X2C8_NOCSI|nr:siderophore-interacting protein [Pimelobacter simplex]AIY19365.1 siderophore interacting protein [Pimelobacter simplex]MCG8149496.1 SIP domain-containing protein [Pimelobacter simplex]GEB16134.1 siderophore-interacting protein [Pimelobacter simplex]SFM18304.1 NADPH-dependent ferric siderophore reductase, contains FAD-binding and SIP domains [Pimelobacter simplex]
MHGEVLATEQLSPHLVRVVLGGAGLAGFTSTGDADEYVNCFFRPDDAPYTVPFDEEAVRDLPRPQRPFPRRITVRRWDAERGELTLDIAAHGDVGYAGRWALGATPGDRLQLRGPAGGYRPHDDADHYLLVGDESALPAIAACAEAVPAGRPVVVVAEVEDAADEIPLSSPGALEVHWVHRAGRTGDDEVAGLLADAVAALPRPSGTVSAFVHGEAAATRAVRRVLLGERIVDAERLSCSPYWRRGHDDESWRAIKAAWVRETAAEELPAR